MRSRPIRLIWRIIDDPVAPVPSRNAQAAAVESNSSRLTIGISRVASLPSWWQSWQPSFNPSMNCSCVRIAGLMPLSAVPGKSAGGGTSISEYQ